VAEEMTDHSREQDALWAVFAATLLYGEWMRFGPGRPYGVRSRVVMLPTDWPDAWRLATTWGLQVGLERLVDAHILVGNVEKGNLCFAEATYRRLGSILAT
jgi:hypothetical protein